MKFFILTDLEGPAGVDNFSQTRTSDVQAKGPAMRQLAREVNACIEGIHAVHPDAHVDVWDGHGSRGLIDQKIVNGNLLPREVKGPYNDLTGYAAQLFVGQHAMAGTINGPLCHSYSSLHVMYYRLNGVFIGEFGCRALVAGVKGVPTIFLSGDDKAALEAQMFIPEIVTAVVKKGRGLEAAEHLSREAACDLIRNRAAEAVRRIGTIRPFTGISPPFELEIRYYEPQDPSKRKTGEGITWIDERTVQMVGDDLAKLPV